MPTENRAFAHPEIASRDLVGANPAEAAKNGGMLGRGDSKLGPGELSHSRSSLNRRQNSAHVCVARGIRPRKLASISVLDSNLAPRAEH